MRMGIPYIRNARMLYLNFILPLWKMKISQMSPNHCATTVQRSLQKAGIDTKSDIFVPVNSGIGQMIHLRTNPYLPSDAYRAIKQNNLKGYELKTR